MCYIITGEGEEDGEDPPPSNIDRNRDTLILPRTQNAQNGTSDDSSLSSVRTGRATVGIRWGSDGSDAIIHNGIEALTLFTARECGVSICRLQ